MPGECKEVTFTLFTNQLGVYDEKQISAVRQGEVEVMVGNSFTNLPLTGSFEIVGLPAGVDDSKVYFSEVQVLQ
jgi:hypothetical protein